MIEVKWIVPDVRHGSGGAFHPKLMYRVRMVSGNDFFGNPSYGAWSAWLPVKTEVVPFDEYIGAP